MAVAMGQRRATGDDKAGAGKAFGELGRRVSELYHQGVPEEVALTRMKTLNPGVAQNKAGMAMMNVVYRDPRVSIPTPGPS